MTEANPVWQHKDVKFNCGLQGHATKEAVFF
jgi:hypothetical protein